MRIASALAAISLAEADVLARRSVEIKELIQEELSNFVKRAIARAHDSAPSRRSPHRSRRSAATAFNKSHSVAYSILSYQTAWFKTYYPAELWRRCLSSEIATPIGSCSTSTRRASSASRCWRPM